MLLKLNYWWRIFATGLCFSCFGLGGLLISVTAIPVIKLLPKEAKWKEQINQQIIHNSFRLFVWFMQFCGVLKVSIEGTECLQAQDNQLIIANHPTLIDIVVLISVLSHSNCIIKNSLLRNPFVRGVVSAAGYISNDDPQALIDDCVNSISDGRSVIIFPEGTRSTPGSPLIFKRGAANMAVRGGLDITPVIISCQPLSLTKELKWYEVPENSRVHLSLRFQAPISVKPFVEENANPSLAARKLTRHLQNYFQTEVCCNE